MTLHEAIIQILTENNRPMTTSEIATEINDNLLYQRNDKRPIEASQIAARINKYPHLFKRIEDKIKLIR